MDTGGESGESAPKGAGGGLTMQAERYTAMMRVAQVPRAAF